MKQRTYVGIILWFLAGFFGPVGAFAQTAHVATVTEIVDGDTLFIDVPFMDSREIRLVGIQSPKLPLGRSSFKAWPLAEEAKEFLSQLTLGKKVEISFGGRRMDRHGRLLAHLHVLTESGVRKWVQGEILLAGLARVYSFADNRSFVPELMALETSARRDRTGIWALLYYAVRNPDPVSLGKLLGTFQLIEGRIVEATRVRGRTYLNFGSDWRSDFTVSIASKDTKKFKDSGVDLLALSGQSIRVRGWLDDRNGPMITLTHPEQLELLPR